MTHRSTSTRLLILTVIVLSPFLLNQTVNELPDDIPQATYVELNPRWEYAGVINDSAFSQLAAAVVLPATEEERGRVLAFDSSGTVVEFEFVNDRWEQTRRFSVGVPVSAVTEGKPQHDRKWRIYVGSPNGQITEMTKTNMGWTSNPVIRLEHRITALHASHPGVQGVSQMFAIDASGHVTNFWIGMNQDWVTRDVPDISGGASDLCLSQTSRGLYLLTAGSSGDIYKFAQDTMGFWSGELWASMPAGVQDMASSADPTGSDAALYYSGVDGEFRYLFHEHKSDDIARVPVAGGVDYLIGKRDELRYNEFFGISDGEFCQFEFAFSSRAWERVPLTRLQEPVVSVSFRAGREWPRKQIFVATADGFVHEFVRQPSPDKMDN